MRQALTLVSLCGTLLLAGTTLAREVRVSRFEAIRSATRIHSQLRRSRTPVNMAKSKILSNRTAAAKKYGDSWTCRSSTGMLIRQLADIAVYREALEQAARRQTQVRRNAERQP